MEIKRGKPFYSVGEEIANSVTHGLGLALSIAGLVLLILHAAANGGALHITSFAIYGATLILLYLASTLYHAVWHAKTKVMLKRLDHSAIFLLIAGTYTPLMIVNIGGAWGWSVFGVVWGLAVIGILQKIICIHKFQKISVAVYIFMGWICVIAFKEMISSLPMLSLILLALGGLSYTVGVIFYRRKSMPYSHAVWHLFVLGGSVFHYFSILKSF